MDISRDNLHTKRHKHGYEKEILKRDTEAHQIRTQKQRHKDQLF